MEKMNHTQEGVIRRDYKDTLFRMIFRENAVYMNMKNDLAFVMDFYLNLYEHQSTFSPNMPLRDLFYIAKELQAQIDTSKLYRTSIVKIPTPRFLVFYNGMDNQPERQELRLSDAYENSMEKPELELVVTMLNINIGKNQELLEQCKILKEYMLYVEKVRNYAKDTPLEEAVERAVSECIQEGILSEFLSKYRKEAIEVSIFEYDEEKAMKYIREDEFSKGLREGIRIFVEFCKELPISRQETLEEVCKKFSLEKETAQDYMNQYWKE